MAFQLGGSPPFGYAYAHDTTLFYVYKFTTCEFEMVDANFFTGSCTFSEEKMNHTQTKKNDALPVLETKSQQPLRR